MKDIVALALKTSEVEVTDRLNTEHITVKMHQSDMVFQVRLPDEDALLHIEAQTDDSTHKPMISGPFIGDNHAKITVLRSCDTTRY